MAVILPEGCLYKTFTAIGKEKGGIAASQTKVVHTVEHAYSIGTLVALVRSLDRREVCIHTCELQMCMDVGLGRWWTPRQCNLL